MRSDQQIMEPFVCLDALIIGGGNARLLKRLPGGVVVGDNAKALAGGFRLWKIRAAHVAGGIA